MVGIHTWDFADDSIEGISFGILETTVQERIRLWGVGPVAAFGPLSGTLNHDADEYIEYFQPEFTADADQFTIAATFVNPYEATTNQQWDYGFRFGKTDEANDAFSYLLIRASGYWEVFVRQPDGSSATVVQGTVAQLRTGSGEENHLSLSVDGPYGWIYVNGLKVLDQEGFPTPFYGKGIDLGGEYASSHEGSVAVVTGIYGWAERVGATTDYADFIGFTYDHDE